MGSARPATARAQRRIVAIVAAAVVLASGSTAEAATAIEGSFESSLGLEGRRLDARAADGRGGWRRVRPRLRAERVDLRSPELARSLNRQGHGLHGRGVGANSEAPREGLPGAPGTQHTQGGRIREELPHGAHDMVDLCNPSLLRARHGKSALRLGCPVLGEGGDVLDIDAVLVRDSRDLIAPSDVSGLTVTDATASTISVTWSPAFDDVSVGGYGIYLDGRLLASSTSTAYTFEGLPCAMAFVVGVDAFDGSGNRSSVTTLAGQSAACPSAPVSLVRPSIAGTPLEGQTLTASPGMWTGEPTLAFTWLRCDASGGGCNPVSAGSTYTLGAADAGSTFRVVVTATNGGRLDRRRVRPDGARRGCRGLLRVCRAERERRRAGTLSSPFRTAQRLVNDLAAGRGVASSPERTSATSPSRPATSP